MIPTFATSLTNRKLIYVLDMPSFQRDFASLKTLDHGTGPAITFTRASNATFFDAAGDLQTAGNNVPRFDHDPASGNSLGLLIEEARTNIALHSADLASAHWTKTSVAVTSNTDVAPDGTTTADTVEDTTTGSTDHLITNSAVGGAANAETFTWSFFIKKTTGATNYPAARLLFSGVSAIQAAAVIDTNSGTITATGGGVVSFTAAVQSVGLYWRVSCTGTNNNAGNTNVAGRLHPAYNLDGTESQDANATGSVVVWGGQLEKGAFPTSYIPTTSAAATRSADSAVVTPVASFYNQAEGTLFAEFQSTTLTTGAAAANRRIVRFDLTADPTTFIDINQNGANDSVRFVSQIAAGAAEFDRNGGSGITNPTKAIIGFAANNIGFAVNGTTLTADTSATIASVDRFLIGRVGGFNGRELQGYIRKIAYFPKRLTNTLLEQLTT